MSLYQCTKCGCVENTALSDYWTFASIQHDPKRERRDMRPEVLAFWMSHLGVDRVEDMGTPCSACSPIWYTRDGRYGDHVPTEGEQEPDWRDRKFGEWHGQFSRDYLPPGEWATDEVGNLRHRKHRSEKWVDHVVRSEPATRGLKRGGAA